MSAVIFAGLASTVLGPIIKKGVAKAVEKVAERRDVPDLKKADAPPVIDAVLDELAKDKVFVNATNSEPWYQSGVAWGANTAVAGSLAVVAPAVLMNGWHLSQYDWNTFLPALITLAGGVFTLIRRFVPGLKPMFSKGA